MAALWWKFSSGGPGTHLLRAIDLGGASQQVWLDGALLEAPPGTTTFTGPRAVLLELQASAAGWTLLVEGAPAESYNPETGPVESPAVAWWKFALKGMGTHHLRVTGIGSAEQQVSLDGTPLEAPPGTMTFTGPAAALLELQQRDGRWVLVVDGVVTHQHNPNSDPADPLHVWYFNLPTGTHQLQVAHIGASGQDIYLDNVQIPAPEGTTMFTGPGGALLEMQRQGDRWVLLVDGALVEASGATPGAGPVEASWTFLAPQTGMAHQMRVVNLGSTGQEVYLDGTLIPAPDGTTTFTGPGGTLLELRSGGHAWSLFVDGVGVEDYNARSTTLIASGSAAAARAPDQRSAVDSDVLPQGVSLDAASGKYKANIKIKGRFKFLGDFSTSHEAHDRYLAAKKEMEG